MRLNRTQSGICTASLLCLIILLSVSLRILYANRYLPNRDSIHYVLVAEQAAEGGFWDEFCLEYSPNMPPLLHLILGGIAILGGDVFFWGMVLMLLSNVIFIYGIYLCGKELFHNYPPAGLCAALLVATTPEFISVGGNIMRDNLYHCVFVFALYCGIRMAESKKTMVLDAIGYGICCTIGFLCRKEAVEIPAILMLWGIVSLFASRANFKKVFQSSMIAFFACLGTALPVFFVLNLYYPVQSALISALSSRL